MRIACTHCNVLAIDEVHLEIYEVEHLEEVADRCRPQHCLHTCNLQDLEVHSLFLKVKQYFYHENKRESAQFHENSCYDSKYDIS